MGCVFNLSLGPILLYTFRVGQRHKQSNETFLINKTEIIKVVGQKF